MKNVILFTILCLFALGCQPSPKAAEQKSTAAATAPKTAPKEIIRPPFPNMANAFWGKQVLKRLKPAEAPTPGHLALWLAAWHESLDGKVEVLKQEAWAYYQETTKPEEKNTALSLLAVSYCLDWSSPQYKDQLVDAVGLVHLAGETDKETLLGQVARAFVFAKAGLVHRGQTLIDILRTDKSGTEDVLLMKAMTSNALGKHNDEYLKFIDEALQKKPNSLRAQWMKAELLNRWSAHKEAFQLLSSQSEPNIFIRLTQAESLMGLQKWQAAKRHLALSEDARAGLTRINLGKLQYLEAKAALFLSDMATFEDRMAKLSMSPLLSAERAVLRALRQKQKDIAGMTAQDLPKPNRLPRHLRGEMLHLWLEWSAVTGEKKYFKDAAKKALDVGLDPGFVYETEAKLKKKLSAMSTDPQEKSALLKESRYLKIEAKKAWPQGMSPSRGQWLLSVRHALLDGAKQWAARKLERMGRVYKRDPVMVALKAQAQSDVAQGWQDALVALQASDRLSKTDLKALVQLAPQKLSGADEEALRLLGKQTQQLFLKNFIGTVLSPKADPHHGHGESHP